MKELKSFKRVVDSFKRLPSVGTKSAERMAYSLLGMEESDLEEFAASILELKNKIHPCPVCGIYTEDDLCEVCKDDTRDKETLIVVSYEKDDVAFEKVDSLHGIYHVLNGALSAVNGIGINDLRIDSLLERINNEINNAGSDYEKITQHSAELSAKEEEQGNLIQQWEELSMELEEL